MRTATRRTGQSGVTLIELIVVTGLLAVLLLVAVPSINSIFGADLKRASHELAETLRYTYQEAVIENMPMRIAYDLDHNMWWVEAADGPALIFRNRKEREAFADFMAAKAESDERVQEEAKVRRSGAPSKESLIQAIFGGEEDITPPANVDDEGMGGLLAGLIGGADLVPASRGGEFQVNEFRRIGGDDGQMDDSIFEPRELPRGTRFLGAWTPQYDDVVEPLDEFEVEAMLRNPEEEQEWTIVYTHIFPGGYMEDSVVYLSDEAGEDIMSLSVEPLLGRVSVVRGRADLPDLRDRESL